MVSKKIVSEALAILLILVFVPCSEQFDVSAYDGHQVYQFKTRNAEHVEKFYELENEGFDFWTRIRVNDTIEMRVPANEIERIGNFFEEHDIEYTVKHDNVSILLEDGHESMARQSSGFDWTKYRSTAEIHAWMEKIARENPNVAEVINIGKTVEGRNLKLMRIGLASGSRKKGYFMDGGIHAREWAAPASVTWMINELIQNRGKYQELLEGMDFYMIPLLNPDGYEYTRSSDRLWRKNRNRISGSRCIGIDGNRNFGHVFGGKGSSSSPCSEAYRGKSAFSEIETRSMRDFIVNRKSVDWRIYNAMHSYGQYILTPWGYDNVVPEDYDELKALADRAAAAVKSVNGRTYTTGGATNLLGPGAGGSDDWAKGSGTFKYSYTYEVRPDSGRGFELPPSEIIPCAKEVWAGVHTMAKYINSLT